MQHERKRVADGFTSLEGGMDSGRSPSIIERNKVAFASNCRFRGGFPTNRPGFTRWNLLFRKADPNNPGYEIDDSERQTTFEEGHFQGSFYDGGPTAMTVVGGRFFTVDLKESRTSNAAGVYSFGHHVKEVFMQVSKETRLTTPPIIKNLNSFVAPAIGNLVDVTTDIAATTSTNQVFQTAYNVIYINGVQWELNATFNSAVVRVRNLSVTPASVIAAGKVINQGADVAFVYPAPGQQWRIYFEPVEGMTTGLPNVSINTVQNLIVTVHSSTSATIKNLGTTAGTVVTAGTIMGFFARDNNSPVTPKAHFCKAEQFLLIQDGQSKCAIFDGVTLRRAQERDEKGYPEVPTGTAMAYGNGRLWVAVNKSYFVAGDIVGGPTGTKEYGYNDALLKFSENTFLNEGGYFRVPSQAGEITTMQFISVPDTSLGQGPLLVGTPTHVFTVSAPVDRDLWKAVQFPIQTVSLVGSGPLSDWSSVLVNGDMFYRANDGIRSFIVARRDYGEWGSTPLSNEMQAVLATDTQALLAFSSAVLFDNRLLMTADPVPLPNGCYFRSIISLDFHPISSMSTRTPPAYDGTWDALHIPSSGDLGTGRHFMQLISGIHEGEERCFFIGRDNNTFGTHKLEFWEISKAARFDYNLTQTAIRIPSYIDTASFSFPFGMSAPPSDALQLKKLEMGELFVDDIGGAVDFSASFRPDQAPSWYSWHSWTETVTITDCDSNYPTPTCRAISCLKPNYRARMRLPTPSDTCETGQSKPARYGYEFQGRIAWTGSARIKKFRMQASETEEVSYGECRS